MEISGDTAAQLALAPMKRALDQQDLQGQQALKLIQSAAPQTTQVQSPAPVAAGTVIDGVKGGNVDTFA